MRVRHLGLCAYQDAWQAMQDFVEAAAADTPEEIWLLQHPPVYTLGKSGRCEDLLVQSDIPLVRSDRGGQITYHAPGQLVAYVLLNISRRRLGLRELVRRLEGAVVALLAEMGVRARGDAAAPGVYVGGEKIAALGLRLRRGWCYHGLSLNVDMALAPFERINPCGYAGLKVTQLAALVDDLPPLATVEEALARELVRVLGEGIPDETGV